MLIVADMHVHLYACYDLLQALAAAERNLALLSAQARNLPGFGDRSSETGFLFLTERADCEFFRDLKKEKILLPGYAVSSLSDDPVLHVSSNTGASFYIVAGRQLVTAEKLEVLALGCEGSLASGLEIQDTIRQVREHGGFPVINWAPGKWLFKRGRVVKAAIRAHLKGERLGVCDISLRPACFPRPSLMHKAVAAGLHLFAGSDPLPLPAEEGVIGSYGIALNGELDESKPLRSFFQLIEARAGQQRIVGSRSSVVLSAYRLGRLCLRNG